MKRKLYSVEPEKFARQKKIIPWVAKKAVFLCVVFFNMAAFANNEDFFPIHGKVVIKGSFERIKVGQDITITGKVTGELGESLPGATVKVKGSKQVVSTGQDGSFSITAKDTDVLVISFIGYITKEVTVGNQKQLNIRLKPSQNELSDIVVIGY